MKYYAKLHKSYTRVVLKCMLTVQNLKFMSAPGHAGMILNENEMKNILNTLD